MEKSCCTKGILYGILPHSFCIAFVVLSAIGAVTTTAILKNIMLTPYFLQILFAFSIIMATFSAIIYLRRCNCLNKQGVRSKWKYLTILYGMTIFINFLMFSYVLPVLANMGSPNAKIESANSVELSLRVDIPCAGHAPLIIDELKKCKGIESIKFEPPNIFKITYDSVQTYPEEIMAVEILKTYKTRRN